MACLCGFWVSIHQTKVAAGAKYWQEWWELQVSKLEKKLADKLEEIDSYKAYGNGRQDKFNFLFSDDDTFKNSQKISLKNKLVDDALIHQSCYGVMKNYGNKWIINPLILQKYSVGKVPISTGLVLMFIWLSLLFHTFDIECFKGVSSLFQGHAHSE